MWNKSSKLINLIDTYNHYNKHYKAIINIKNGKKKRENIKKVYINPENKYKIIKRIEIMNENKKLYNNWEKIQKRNMSSNYYNSRKFKRFITNNKKSFLERKIINLKDQNNLKKNRLKNVKSNYSLNNWKKSFKKSCYIKENIINYKRKIEEKMVNINFPLKKLCISLKKFNNINNK